MFTTQPYFVPEHRTHDRDQMIFSSQDRQSVAEDVSFNAIDGVLGRTVMKGNQWLAPLPCFFVEWRPQPPSMKDASPLIVSLSILLIISGNLLRSEVRSSIPIPEFDKQALLNGMEILFLPGSDRRVPFVLMIKHGAAFDPVTKWGVTYLMTRLALEGTEERTGREISGDLKELGAELAFRVGWDAIFFFGTAPVDQVADVLGVLAEVVIHPRLQEETFQKVREQVLEELEEETWHTETITQALFASTLFQGNPYQHPVKGISQTVRSVNLIDVKIQYRKLVLPNQAQLALYCSGDRGRLFTALSRHWGSWVKAEPAPFSFSRARGPRHRQILLIDRPLPESLFRWGRLGVQHGAPDYYALKVFEQYLTLCLPEWAKQVASQDQIKALPKVQARKMRGDIQFSVQAPSEQLVSYLQKYYELLADLQQGHIDASKLQEARQLAVLEFKNSLDDPLGRLYRLLETELYSLGVSYIATYGSRLSRVTAEILQATLQEYLSTQDFLLVVAGPEKILRTQLEEFGKVEVPFRLN